MKYLKVPSRHDLLLLLAALTLAWSTQLLLTGQTDMGLDPRWDLIPARVPLQMTTLSGALRDEADVLNLDHFEGIRTRFEDGLALPLEIQFRAFFPQGGAVRVSLGEAAQGQPFAGAAFALDFAQLYRIGISDILPNGSVSPEVCGAPPERLIADDSWRTVRLEVKSGWMNAFVDNLPIAHCPTRLHRVTHLALRSGLRRIQVDDLKISSTVGLIFQDAFTHPFSGTLALAGLFGLALVLFWGVRRLELALHRRAGLSEESAALAFSLTQLPLFGLLLTDAPIMPLLEALRLNMTPPRTLIVGTVLLLTLMVKLCTHVAQPGHFHDTLQTEATTGKPSGSRWKFSGVIFLQLLAAFVLSEGPMRPAFTLITGLIIPSLWLLYLRQASSLPIARALRIEGIVALLLWLLVVGKVIWQVQSVTGISALWSGRGGAWMPYALGALALQLVFRLFVVNLSARQVRGSNFASLALVLLIGLTAELAARQSYLDASLGDSGMKETFEQLNYLHRVAEYREWPDKLFPVAFEPRGKNIRQRIVCLGSSSTAGAFQMKDMKQFYPFLLERRLNQEEALRQTEVLNQGVGGWNTFLMRLYVERAMEKLDPDLITLYVGHNDILGTTPHPFREYWEAYKKGQMDIQSPQGVLNKSRLYVLFKQLLVGTGKRVPTVPIPDARESLERIVTLMKERGGRVLLMSEGLSPNPKPLAEYFAMLKELSDQKTVYYLDSAEFLSHEPQAETFLDDCHLTEQGHERLAEAIAEYLEANPGLLSAAGKTETSP